MNLAIGFKSPDPTKF